MNFFKVQLITSCCQFGPDADVKLYRSAPGTVSIDAVMLNVLGELRSQGLKVDGMSIDQLIRKILQEIMEKDPK